MAVVTIKKIAFVYICEWFTTEPNEYKYCVALIHRKPKWSR